MSKYHGSDMTIDWLSRRAGAHAVLLMSVFLCGIAPRGPVHAGSVFMKNGYIIQGEIVDRDAESVVLGWPNGKVSIAWRFIDQVSIEPQEEQNLLELEQMRRQVEQRATTDQQVSMLSEASSTADLPATLDGFLQAYDLFPRPGAGDSAADPSAAPAQGGLDPVIVTGPDGTESTDAVVVTDLTRDSADALGDPVASAIWRVQFRPPRGWKERASTEALHVVSAESVNGFTASLNVQLVSVGALDPSEYVALLEDEHRRVLEGHEVLAKGWRQVGAERAFEIVSRGRFAERTAVVRQCLVVRDDDVWLLSAFTGDDAIDGDHGLVETTLATFEFLAAPATE